jgi:hypothetical protein
MLKCGLLTPCEVPSPATLVLMPAGWVIFRGAGYLNDEEVEVLDYLWPDTTWRRDAFPYFMKNMAEDAMDDAGLGVPPPPWPLSRERDMPKSEPAANSRVYALALILVAAIVAVLLWR